MTAAFVIVLVVAAVLWAATVANTVTIKSSDAAGNALSHAFGVFMAIALFVLLAILVVLAAARGAMPVWMRIASVILVPASGAATIAAIEIMSQGTEWPVRWPLVIPALAPALIIGLALWTALPSVRGLAPASVAGGIALGGLALLSIAPWPLLRARGQERRAGPGELQTIRAARRARWRESDRAAHQADFDAIEHDAPLYAWLPFTEPGDPLRDRALAAIRRLPERQRELEEMVRAGNEAAVREVPALATEATSALCDAAREAVVFHARRTRPGSPEEAAHYARYARDVEYYMPTVEWLIARGCPLGDGLAELETTARAYDDSPERARFLERLAALQQSAGPR
jgi:hypothetical protein